jgi:CheY-like chemotaxis protein
LTVTDNGIGIPPSMLDRTVPLVTDAETAAAAEAPPEEAAAASERTRRATKPAVLIVEDNEDAREMLALLLEGRGFPVGTAADGREGVEKGSSGEWDVAIVDIGLPGLDGYEVARRLRASDDGGDLLLIALSGYGRPEDRARSAEAGFDRHLIKPVEPSVLFELLEQV